MTESKAGPLSREMLTTPGVVSVIIPCYRQTAFLRETIASILNQSYSNFEIIVVDDGSPDSVEEVTKLFQGVCLIRQPNQGTAKARNNGLKSSKGDFIVFLDADDRLLPNALSDGVEFLVKQPSCAFV